MASYNLAPIGNDAPFFLSTGVAASGYKLFTYTAGSTTKQNTYQDNAGNTANANPILLNSSGYPASGGSVVEIWLTAGVNYKFVLAPSTDTDPPASPVWTRDNLVGINDVTSSISEWVAGPTPTYISATSFSLVGDQTSNFTVGRRLKTTNTAGTIYSTITASAFTSLTTVTVVNDSSNLDSGLSAVSYGLLTSNNPSVPLGEQFVNSSCQGRLTLATGLPVTTNDVTAATTLYFSPYVGNTCALYDGTKWVRYKFSELSIAVPATTATMYDVWLFNNAGVLSLELLAWTNDTTRATALTTQDGIYVKTGATGRRYLGSFRTTGVAGQTEDSIAKRYVWNYYNRVVKRMKVTDATATWNYTTATWRQANGAAANQLDFVVGVSEEPVFAQVFARFTNTNIGVGGHAGIGLDGTVGPISGSLSNRGVTSVANTVVDIFAQFNDFPGIGRHFLTWLELSDAVGTTTWGGTTGTNNEQMGIHGWVRG